MIVPLGQTQACYACHRIESTVPSQNPQVSIPITFQAMSGKANHSLTQLTTSPGADKNAAISPDGQHIAFESDRSGVHQVWRMNLDGSDQQQLTQGPDTHGWAKWSADGKQIVCWGYNEDAGIHSIKVMNPDGS